MDTARMLKDTCPLTTLSTGPGLLEVPLVTQ